MERYNELLARQALGQHAQSAPIDLHRDQCTSSVSSNSSSCWSATNTNNQPINGNTSSSSISNNSQQQVSSRAGSAKNKKLFPQKLWDLINDKKYNFCLRWSDDGQLVYLNRDEFEDSYLKTAENQFHTQKAISFVRQMNMYGFRKVDDCYYENDYFKRDCEYLLKDMIRKHPIKGPLGGQSSGLDQSSNLTTSGQTSMLPLIFGQTTQHNPPGSPTSSSLQAAAMLAAGHFANPDLKPGAPTLASPIIGNQFNARASRQLVNEFQDNRSMLKSFGNQDLIHLDATAEDSFSSSDDYCCNAGISQAETLLSVLERLDFNRLSGVQQLYQQLLTRQLAAAPAESRAYDLATANRMLDLDEKRLPNVMQEASTTITRNTKQSQQVSTRGFKSQSIFEASNQLSDWNNDSKPKSIAGIIPEAMMNAKPRDNSKLNRSFKRSVDSILDSNNNNNNNQNPERSTAKRAKVAVPINVESSTSKQARNLVSQVAIDRDARLDDIVIGVASRYTELFVQTLFDTAQVIARHSNGPGSNESTLTNDNLTPDSEKDQKHDIGHEQVNINLSDLTSAIRLLPSKLVKILE